MQQFRPEAMLEALLFAAPKPIALDKLAEVLEMPLWECEQVLERYAQLLKTPERGIMLRFVAGGWQLVTKPELAELVASLVAERQYKLSKPTIETLAIIAYKQPTTRAEIEAIRGVKVEKTLATLLEKGLIVEAGRKDAIGRPILYATSDAFLEYYGLKSLEDLPAIGRLQL
ncbi:MAG TPA: SMC-Scp complex subunit ScpB [Firmicutes bacterium]|jgi:segregation and condensation protein B|nr:SMC-Scp complex subunit ScpB [Bacillota bacterium]